jgi:hypothetical protein
MVLKQSIHKFQYNMFLFVTYLTWFLYIIIALGLSINAPEYLYDLQYYIKIYVSLFLVLRFNPFRNVEFTELDKKIVFSAGLFLITTTAINEILMVYFNNINNYLYFLKMY